MRKSFLLIVLSLMMLGAQAQNVFDMKLKWSSGDLRDENNCIHGLSTPLVADLDGDGLPEVIGVWCVSEMTDHFAVPGGYITHHLVVLNGKTGEVKYKIQTHNFQTMGQTVAIADVNRDGKCEVFVVSIGSKNSDGRYGDKYVYCYDGSKANSDPEAYIWKSKDPLDYMFTPMVADVNNDGIPELVCGNTIFNAITGACLVKGEMAETGMGFGDPHQVHGTWNTTRTGSLGEGYYLCALADIDGDRTLEICAGNTTYKVTINNPMGTSGNRFEILNQCTTPLPYSDMYDGQTMVLDFDNDDDLDVCVLGMRKDAFGSSIFSGGQNHIGLYVWEGQTSELIGYFICNPKTFSLSVPFAADIDGDGYPEIMANGWILGYHWLKNESYMDMMHVFRYKKGFLSAANNTNAKNIEEVFTRAQATEYSESAGFSVFDFNQDDKSEIVYRGRNQLYILDGTNLGKLSVPQTCISGTLAEYPVIADVDQDGHADIIVTDQFEITSASGRMQVFESATPGAWPPARKVWNQWPYNVVNINEDMSVPQYVFDITRERNGRKIYNGFLQQAFYDPGIDNFVVVCESDLPYRFGDSLLTESGEYEFRLTSSHGLDSLIILHLAVQSSRTDIDEYVCEADLPYHFGDSLLTESGDYEFSLKSFMGCDSLVVLHLNVIPSRYVMNVSVCEADLPYHFGDSLLSQAGDYEFTFNSSTGCDSIVTLHLEVTPAEVVEMYQTVSDKEFPYQFMNHKFTSSGDYSFAKDNRACGYLEDVEGNIYKTVQIGKQCWMAENMRTKTMPDGRKMEALSTIVPNFVTDTRYYYERTDTIVGHVVLYPWGTANDISSGGQTNQDAIIQGICPDGWHVPTYKQFADMCNVIDPEWNRGAMSTASGAYTLPSNNKLAIKLGDPSCRWISYGENYANLETATFSTVENTLGYNWGNHIEDPDANSSGFTATVSGYWRNGSYWYNGCLVLWTACGSSPTGYGRVVKIASDNTGIYHQGWSQTAREGYAVRCVKDTLMEAEPEGNKCELIKLHLKVTHEVDPVSVCENELPYMFMDSALTESGVYEFSVSTSADRDSVVVLHFTVNPTYHLEQDAIACENDLPYHFLDTLLTESGDYVFTRKTSTGCDSIVTLHVHVTPVHQMEQTITICESELPYQYMGEMFSSGGEYEIDMNRFLCGDKISDVEGNQYKTVRIGSQCWMAEDMRTKTLPDGTALVPLTTGANYNTGRYYYERTDDIVGTSVYYPWSTACNSSSGNTDQEAQLQGICPQGWHVPTYRQFAEMCNILDPSWQKGSENVTSTNAGAHEQSSQKLAVKLAVPEAHWQAYSAAEYGGTPTTSTLANTPGYNWKNHIVDADANASGFSAAPKGYWKSGSFYFDGAYSMWVAVSSTLYNYSNLVKVDYNTTGIRHLSEQTSGKDAYPVRCVMDMTIPEDEMLDEIPSSNGCRVMKLQLNVLPTLYQTVEEQVCDNELPYHFIDRDLLENGEYQFELKSSTGCDSIVMLNLTIVPTHFETSETVCEADLPYMFHGQSLTESGDYEATLQSSVGCDSIVTLHLTVIPNRYEMTLEVCEVDLPFEFNGRNLPQAGDYEFSFTSSVGCDSVLTLHLDVVPTFEDMHLDIAEEDLPYRFGDSTLTQAGDYILFSPGDPCGKKLVDIEGNQYNTVRIGSQCWMQENMRVKTYPDGTPLQEWTVALRNQGAKIYGIVSDPTIGGEQVLYTWRGATNLDAANKDQTLKVQGICPNGWHIPSYRDFVTLFSSIDPNWDSGPENATINGNVGNTANSDNQLAIKLSAKDGVWEAYNGPGVNDPTATCHQTVNSPGYAYVNNPNDPSWKWNESGFNAYPAGYIIKDKTYTVPSGTSAAQAHWWNNGALNLWTSISDGVATAASCPECVKIQCYYTGVPHFRYRQEIKQSYSVRCVMDEDNDDQTSMSGPGSVICDQIINLHLAVHQTHFEYSHTVCEADLPYEFCNSQLTESGDYEFRYTSSYGLDSIITLHLTVHPARTEVDDHICEADLPYHFLGRDLTESGDYEFALKSFAGCDSLVVLHLEVVPTLYPMTVDVCEAELPYYFMDTVINESGDYVIPIRGFQACGDILTDVEGNQYSTVQIGSQCWMAENLRTKTMPDGRAMEPLSNTVPNFNSSMRYYYETEDTIAGYVVLYPWATAVDRTTAQTNQDARIQGVCPNGWHVPTYKQFADMCKAIDPEWEGNASLTPSLGGYIWGSYNKLAVKLADPSAAWFERERWEILMSDFGFEYDPDLYPETPGYNWQYGIWDPDANASGFSAIPSGHWYNGSYFNYGDMELWTSIGYSSTGYAGYVDISYRETGVSFIGWDNTAQEARVVRCVKNENDTAMQIPPSHGCEQSVALHFTVHKTEEEDVYVKICETELPYFFEGVGATLYEAGDYQYVVQTEFGCDSIINLHLTVNPIYHTEVYQSVCDNELPFFYLGGELTASGDYDFPMLSENVCDSLVTLHLTINPTYHHEDYVTVCDNELPFFYQDSALSASGEYDFMLKSEHGCDSLVTLHFKVNPTYHHEDAVTICQSGLPYTYGKRTFDENTVSGDYDVHFQTVNGCDSVITLHLTVNASENTEFCMVTVNEQNMNQLVWEKNAQVDHYNLYREGDLAGRYDLIASVPYSNSSVWTDSASNTNVRSYRYRISSVDYCNVESELSPIHKTMHLTIGAGINNSWNLVWTEYEGAMYSTYRIYRGTTSGNLEHIATLPANNTSYTDQNVSADVVYYQVVIVLDEPCNPMKAFNTIKSNMATNDASGIDKYSFEHSLIIYPNPNHGRFTVRSSQYVMDKVQVFDMEGRLLQTLDCMGQEAKVDISTLAAGSYVIKAFNKNQVVGIKRIVKD